ncbi:MAG: hypothetical protein J7L69_00815 [Desulfobulbaceae bacterium]|nr:hypothetical protein [Desulfobulbaceae bacterium]
MKKLTTALLAITFLISTAGMGLAASAKCTVTAIDANNVTMDCGNKAKKLKVGDTLKVKTVKKQAVEGC